MPGAIISWWDTEAGAVETATAEPLTFTAEGPPAAAPDAGPGRRMALAAAALALALAALVAMRPRAKPPRPASEARLYRDLTRAVQRGPVAAIRRRLAAWLGAAGQGASAGPAVEAALLALERTRYGPAVTGTAPDRPLRRAFASALDQRRRQVRSRPAATPPPLPPLNPLGTPKALGALQRTAPPHGVALRRGRRAICMYRICTLCRTVWCTADSAKASGGSDGTGPA